MKRLTSILTLLLTLSMITSCSRSPEGSGQPVNYGAANTTATAFISNEDALVSTGLPADILDSISNEQQALIFATLPEGSTYLPADLIYRTAYQPAHSNSIQVQTYEDPADSELESLEIGIDVDVLVWQEGGTLHIYPSYESRNAIQSHGKDTFASATSPGCSIVPNAHAASLWAKPESEADWEALGMMQYSNISIHGYSYEGETLGQKNGKGFYKAHSYFSAHVDEPSSSQDIILGYAHDSSRGAMRNYSLTVNDRSLGVQPGTEDVLALMDVYRIAISD